jgi:LAS superfamily LD-carboxypeptidase LdcB
MENDYMLLVNKTNECPDFLNFEIVDVHSRYADNRSAEIETFKAFKLLQAYAKECGFDMNIVSGYRSKERQQRIFNNIAAKKGKDYAQKFVAMPGYSEHQTGLALDVCMYLEDWVYVEHGLPENFKEFLQKNIYKYGFILRYPEGKENITGYNHEPWHIRYINDAELAKYIYEHNLCLEEYLELKKEKPKMKTLK